MLAEIGEEAWYVHRAGCDEIVDRRCKEERMISNDQVEMRQELKNALRASQPEPPEEASDASSLVQGTWHHHDKEVEVKPLSALWRASDWPGFLFAFAWFVFKPQTQLYGT